MRIEYRPEIDGLRAIAVGIVILYHAQITILGHDIFKGGFIGVDIFLVISGYLITSIILKELITTGSFSFKHFYERRVRRILPPLLFVMLVSLPFAWIYLLPSSFVDFSKSIIYSLGFGSNFYFHYSGQQYGADNALLKPFLHTWSLSIEEQYYILFPVVLLITFKYLKKYIIHVFVFGFVASLGFAEWTSREYPSSSFYFLHTRLWELLSGSILAYLEVSKGHRSNNKTLNLILPTIGVLLICHSVFFFNDEILHPSLFTLYPIIGVCLVIWFSGKNEIITKILSTKLFVSIGLISYSLYLWHYPIFAFSRVSSFTQDDLYKKVGLVVVILVLSIISYFFIEKFFRNKKNNFLKLLIILLTSFFVIFFFNIASIYKEGFKESNRFSKVVNNTYDTLDYRNNFQNGFKCHNRMGDKGFCIFNQLSKNDGDIVLLGDSLTDALLSNLIKQVSNTKYRLIHMSYSSNLYLPNFIRFDKNVKKIDKNESWHSFRKNFIENKTNKNTFIIFYGDYNHYFEKRLNISKNKIVEYETKYIFSERKKILLDYKNRKQLLFKKIKNSIKELSESKKVLLVYPSPVSPINILNHIKNNNININKNKNFYKEDHINYSKNFYRKYNSDIINFFDKLNLKNVYKIELEELFCPKNQCFFYDNKNAYIFDQYHPSYEGSRKINDLIMNEIQKLEFKSN